MSRAHDLFLSLGEQGIHGLNELIADREPESMFLDFKRAHDDGAPKRLGPSDNKNLSKAISGFSNSEGGLLIWGVDCRVDRTTGNEEVSKHPVVNALGFRTKIESAISRFSTPPQKLIECLHIDEPGGRPSGYVIMLIPKSTQGPVRSTVTDHYHIRAGSSFEIVSHHVLAGMFGQHPTPILWPQYLSHQAKLTERKDELSIRFGIVAYNGGAVIAERPFLSIRFGSLPEQFIHVETPHPNQYQIRKGLLPIVAVMSGKDEELAPGAADHICNISLTVPRKYREEIVIEMTMGCKESSPQFISARLSSDSLERMDSSLEGTRVAPAGGFIEFTPSVL